MKVFRKIMLFSGGVALGIITLMTLHQYSVNGAGRDEKEIYVAAEPTPVMERVSTEQDYSVEESVSDESEVLVPILLDKVFVETSEKSREQLIDEIVAQFNWDGNEEGKEAFRQELLESDANGWALSQGFDSAINKED